MRRALDGSLRLTASRSVLYDRKLDFRSDPLPLSEGSQAALRRYSRPTCSRGSQHSNVSAEECKSKAKCQCNGGLQQEGTDSNSGSTACFKMPSSGTVLRSKRSVGCDTHGGRASF